MRAIAGTHAIREVLKVRPASVKEIWVEKNWESREDLRQIRDEMGRRFPRTILKSEEALSKLARSHQGAIAFSDAVVGADWKKIEQAESAVVLALDQVEDPHNLGAILRTSWLMGASALLVPEERSAGLTASVHKVAAGGAEHVPLEQGQFLPKLKNLKDAGFWVFGLDGAQTSTSIFQMKIPSKVIWVMGSEEKGLRTTTRKVCDEVVSLPQANATASYNVSVAAAMILFETSRQLRLKL